ncbi:MAG TPA: hypothetical protein VJU82_16390 [Acidobacteriaceae bacterium]|nr:hypothetical protein [Acidobacteriaceae bacterium]
MRGFLIAVICCSLATATAGAGSSDEQLSLSRDSSGDLLATLHTAGDAVVAFDYVKDGCYFSPNHSEPCFSFTAVNGTAPVAIQGCVSNADAKLGIAGQVGCKAADFKGVKLVAIGGGTINLYGGNGHHNDCSPLPVSVAMHGNTWHVAAWDGCTETIACPDGIGQVDADPSDALSSKCDPAFVTRHGAQ